LARFASPPTRRSSDLVERSLWPAIHAPLVELVREHRSTLVFGNSRRLAERLAAALNDLAGEPLVLAHHGSLAREKRLEIEEALSSVGHTSVLPSRVNL